MKKINLNGIVSTQLILIATVCYTLLFSTNFSFSQTVFCIDSLAIRYGAYCQPDFEPVCACDGVTYRNQCFAQNNGIVNYNQGICEDIAIDANPVPTISNIYIDVILKYQGDMDLYIYNHWGKLYLYRKYYQITELYFPLNIENFEAGPYIIVVRAGDSLATKKIIKQAY